MPDWTEPSGNSVRVEPLGLLVDRFGVIVRSG